MTSLNSYWLRNLAGTCLSSGCGTVVGIQTFKCFDFWKERGGYYSGQWSDFLGSSFFELVFKFTNQFLTTVLLLQIKQHPSLFTQYFENFNSFIIVQKKKFQLMFSHTEAVMYLTAFDPTSMIMSFEIILLHWQLELIQLGWKSFEFC